MENNTNLTLAQTKSEVSINFFASEDNFNLGQRMAKVFASSNLVPQQYQNNVGNVMIAMNMAQRMKADPLMVMQNLCIVHGTPAFEAKFAIACFNATGKYTPIRYEEIGEKGKDSYGMYAYSIDKGTGDLLRGPEITIALAKKEGWYDRNAKWKSIPQLMLRYRAASWFIRTTDPGVMMGFQTTDEAEDVEYATIIEDKSNAEIQHEANKENISFDNEDEEETVGVSNPTEQLADSDKPIGQQPTPSLFK